jgi:multidrug efflux pump subunit AcrA (membrane-fusion protein)
VTGVVKKALLIPQRAVADIQGDYQVAVVEKDNKVSMRKVKVGQRVGPMWVIENGLNPGEFVVADGGMKVRDGSRVNPNVEGAQGETKR